MGQEDWSGFPKSEGMSGTGEDWSEFGYAETDPPGRLVKEFNRGVFIDLGLLPTNIINLSAQATGALGNIGTGESPAKERDPLIRASMIAEFGLPEHEKIPSVSPLQIPTQGYQDFFREIGWIPEEGDETEGFGEWTARFMGSGVGALSAIAKWGNALNQGQKVVSPVISGTNVLPSANTVFSAKGLPVASNIAPPVQGVAQTMASATAAAPGAALAAEASAAAGSAAFGEGARQADLPDWAVATAELLGAFSPAALLYGVKKLSFSAHFANAMKRIAPAFTKRAGEVRAAKRLQESVSKGSPREAAERIDVKSKESPARQTEDEGLMGLEKRILEEEPELAAQIESDLISSREASVAEAGQIAPPKGMGRTRQLLIEQKNYLLDLLDVRAAQAAKELDVKISSLDPDASPRDISRVTRQVLERAHGDARAQESALWTSIDSDAPLSIDHAKESYRRIVSTRSTWDDPDDIPSYVKRAFGANNSQIDAIRAQLGLQAGEPIPESVLAQIPELQGQRFVFNDVRALRHRMLEDIRLEGGKEAPNRNKIRILSEIANGKTNRITGAKEYPGLLDDMGESGIEGAEAAREFSNKVNTLYNRGRIGKVLAYDVHGADRITEAGTLDYLLSGADAPLTVGQLNDAVPDSSLMVEQFLKAKFLTQLTDPVTGAISRPAATRWIKQWEAKGAFEVFPNMREEMKDVVSASQRFAAASKRAKGARAVSRAPGKARLAFWLDSDPGAEMTHALNAKRPAAVLRNVVRRVNGDQLAMGELRHQFVEEALSRSHSGSFYRDGDPIVSGRKFSSFLDQHESTMKILEFDPASQARLKEIASRLRRYDLKAGAAPDKIVDDIQSDVLDFVGSYIGARAGGRVGEGMGSQLVMAGRGATQARKTIYKYLRNYPREILVQAANDPALYKALLTKNLIAEGQPLLTTEPLHPAEKIIKAHLIAMGAAKAEEFEEQN